MKDRDFDEFIICFWTSFLLFSFGVLHPNFYNQLPLQYAAHIFGGLFLSELVMNPKKVSFTDTVVGIALLIAAFYFILQDPVTVCLPIAVFIWASLHTYRERFQYYNRNSRRNNRKRR